MVVMAVPAPGLAVKRFHSTVRLSPTDPFNGRVVSDKPACERNRRVKVFRKQDGDDGLYGSTKTTTDGKWSMLATPNGDFYATVTRQRKTGATTTFVCRPGKSQLRHFD
jgi:hypothetical protein